MRKIAGNAFPGKRTLPSDNLTLSEAKTAPVLVLLQEIGANGKALKNSQKLVFWVANKPKVIENSGFMLEPSRFYVTLCGIKKIRDRQEVKHDMQSNCRVRTDVLNFRQLKSKERSVMAWKTVRALSCKSICIRGQYTTPLLNMVSNCPQWYACIYLATMRALTPGHDYIGHR